MTDKSVLACLNLAMVRDTDVGSPDSATDTPASDWKINGITHFVGDHIGVVVHATQDTEQPSVALALRCVIALVSHDGGGVPVIKVRPADVHTLVLDREAGDQDFFLRLNDKVIVIKNERMASPELVEAAQLEAGIAPTRKRQRFGIPMFNRVVDSEIPVAELSKMVQAKLNLDGELRGQGDEVIVTGANGIARLARIEAIVSSGDPLSDVPHIVAVTYHGATDSSLLKFSDWVMAGDKPTVESQVDGPHSAGYSAADIDNVALIDKLMAGEGFSHTRTISVSQARMAPASISILGIAHRKDDLIEISTNGQDWSERRINAIAFDEDTVSVAVDGAVEGDSAIILSAIWFVRPSEAMRARCLLSKRAESIPAGEGAQAYASSSLFRTVPDNSYEVAKAALENGVLFGGRVLSDDELAACLDKPQVKFDIMGTQQERATALEVSKDRLTWDEVSVRSVTSDGLSGYVVQIRESRGDTYFITPEMYVRQSLFQRGQSLRKMVANGTITTSTPVEQSVASRGWRAPAPVGKPVGGSPAFDRPLFREDDDNIRQTQVYLDIDQGIAVDKIPYPGFGNIAQPGQTLIGFFPFFGIDHGVGHILEVFYPDHVQSSSGVWKEHRIVSIYYNTGPDVKCPFDITVSTGLESGTFFKLEPTARIRMLKDNRVLAQHRLLKQEAEQRERMTAAWHSKVDIRFGADAGTATGASIPMSRRPNGRGLMAGSYQADVAGREFRPATGGMFTGRAFGDRPDTVAAYGVKPGPYTGKDLATHCITGGFAIQTMIRDDVKVGDFRLALLHFATEVETLVLGKPGRGFGPI